MTTRGPSITATTRTWSAVSMGVRAAHHMRMRATSVSGISFEVTATSCQSAGGPQLRRADRKRFYAEQILPIPASDALRNKCVCQGQKSGKKSGKKPCAPKVDATVDALEIPCAAPAFAIETIRRTFRSVTYKKCLVSRGQGGSKKAQRCCAAPTLVARGGVEPPIFRFPAAPNRFSSLT
jgi:hypothetical protein